MAQLPVIKQLQAQDFTGAGAWVSKFLYTLNLFMGSVYSALNGNLTFANNMLGQINTVPIKGSSPSTSFIWNFSTLPQGVVLMNLIDTSAVPAAIKTATTVQWSVGAGVVNINNITGLDSTRTYSATFLVIGG